MTPDDYDTAKEYAEDWCGPCKELDVVTVEGVDGDEIEIHYMKDKEFGFTYQVEVTDRKYSTSRKPYPSYVCPDFDYHYIMAFLDEDYLSDVVQKYELTIEVDEPREAYTEGLLVAEYATIDFYTELELTQDEIDDILGTTYYGLEDFDERKHFTKNEYSHCVFFHVYCAPSERDKELGRKYGGGNGKYGFKYEK